jgi:hypothetical protein
MVYIDNSSLQDVDAKVQKKEREIKTEREKVRESALKTF